MSVTVTRLPDEPIIITTFQDPLKPQIDMPSLFDELRQIGNEIKGDFYNIIDLNEGIIRFGDMVTTMGEASRLRKKLAVDMADIGIIHLAIVGSGSLVELVAKAFGQRQYGEIQVGVFTSLDDALATIRGNLS